MSSKNLLILIVKMINILGDRFAMVEVKKLAKIAGVMHEVDYGYSIWSTW